MHTTSKSFGWVSIYTRASARFDSTLEQATEPLNLMFLLQASTEAADRQIITRVINYSEPKLYVGNGIPMLQKHKKYI